MLHNSVLLQLLTVSELLLIFKMHDLCISNKEEKPLALIYKTLLIHNNVCTYTYIYQCTCICIVMHLVGQCII